MQNIWNFLLILQFILMFFIILFVILQRSKESSVLVSSNSFFNPGQADKMIINITKILVLSFFINSLAMNYVRQKINATKNITYKIDKNQKNSIPLN